MNALDFFFLQDNCGVLPKLFLDPSNAQSPSNPAEAIVSYGYSGGGGGYYWPNTDDVLTRQWANTDYTEDPSDPKWSSGTGRCNFILFPFQWYGVDKYGIQAAIPSNQKNWAVYKINERNKGGLGNASEGGYMLPQEANPAIMSDYAMHSTSEDRYNHGTSFKSAYTNVLHIDGSVEGKTIDSTPFGAMYVSSPGSGFYWYR